MALELGDVGFERGGQEDARSVGVGRRGRRLGVQVLEPTAIEIRLQLLVGGRADPEWMPRGEHLVGEAWSREIGRRPDAPSEIVVSLEQADTPAGLREERGAGEGVDSGADEHRVEGRHGARRYQARVPA